MKPAGAPKTLDQREAELTEHLRETVRTWIACRECEGHSLSATIGAAKRSMANAAAKLGCINHFGSKRR